MNESLITDNGLSDTDRITNLFIAYGFSVPLKIGVKHYIISKNHEFFPTVVEIKLQEQNQYYIHFLNNNKRLDRWVEITDLRPILSIQNLDATVPQIISTQNSQVVHTRRASTRRELARRNQEPQSSSNNPYEISYYQKTMIKNINKVFMGGTMYECWYFSPFPGIYANADTLWVCEHCFYYFKNEDSLANHLQSCSTWHPPGNEIYRDKENRVSVFEIDGNHSPRTALFCQCLCLFGKFFLERKTLFYDVKHFKFYLVTTFVEGKGFRVMGFFSKEKKNPENNLSCIVVFPNYQNTGVGKFMVTFSYELSRSEKLISGPETPISDLGRLLYKSFWMEEILKAIKKLARNTSTQELAYVTGITEAHIKSTLDQINLIRFFKGYYVIPFEKNAINKYYEFFKKKRKLPFLAELLCIVK